jgi:folate-binding protein YgfZ
MSTAVIAPPDLVDQGIPWHYGNPLAEQKALSAGEAVVDLSNRAITKLVGVDRLTWLDSLTSHSVAGLTDSNSATTLILSPHGHVEFELHVIDKNEITYLISDVGTGPKLREYLLKMRFMKQVEILDSPELAVVFESVRDFDPNNPTWLVPVEFINSGITPSGSSAGGDAAKYVKARPQVFNGREVIINRADLPARLMDRFPAGSWAYNAYRIAAGVARMVELDHKTLPHEIGLIGPAVHLSKGCYRGQETVARVHNLGKPPRRLVLLHLESGDLPMPAPGDLVKLNNSEVGIVLASAQHFELGPIALGLVKRSIDLSSELLVGSHKATQEEIVTRDL